MTSTTNLPQVEIAVIGGSGLYQLPGLTFHSTVNPLTPWGYASGPISIYQLDENCRICFLARHGPSHHYSPSTVPYQANICALKQLGVKVILAFSAVGSLREEIVPGDFVLTSQLLDWTKQRQATFFGNGAVAHCSVAEPFHPPLARLIKKVGAASLPQLRMHAEKTAVCIEGPFFSTRAESHMFRALGADVINMTASPECKLAREAEITYQLICMATDYDCWRVEEEHVTADKVMATMTSNAAMAKKLLIELLPQVAEALKQGELREGVRGNMEFACMTAVQEMPEEWRKKLRYVLPEYYAPCQIKKE